MILRYSIRIATIGSTPAARQAGITEATSIGAEIARRDQQEIDRAKQLVLPIVTKQTIPKM